METQTTQDNWLKQEAETIKTPSEFEKLPSLKLLPNVVAEFEIDFNKPFEKWEDPETNTVKKIIPVIVNGQRMNWWLNTRNPIYAEIIKLGVAGQTKVKVMQTGTAKNTRYNLVK